jgi:hypothetical protein
MKRITDQAVMIVIALFAMAAVILALFWFLNIPIK